MNLKRDFRNNLLAIIFILSSVTVIGLTNPILANTNDTNSKNASLPTIRFSVGPQPTMTLANMVADFNANFSAQYGFTVALDSSTFTTASQYDTYVATFNAQSTYYDVIEMDVTWPAEFASHGWILPLNNTFNSTYQSQFIQPSIQTGTYNGSIYSVPWFDDSAMLYYRTDILQYANTNGIINDPNGAPPFTWSQLENWSVAMMSNSALVNKFNLTAGFVWQGKSYEGLMCDFMEYLGGTDTYTFLNANQSAATFNTSTGINSTFSYMRSLITSGASPASVLTYDEEGSRAVWNNGNAIFMRNWPYAYSLSLDSANLNGSMVTGSAHNQQQFNVTSMPAENASMTSNGLARTSCLGGFQLGVSAYSQYPAQAKKFIMWLTTAQQQTTYFLGTGETPTLKALYNSPAIVNSRESYVQNYLPIFERAIPRPVSPYYIQMSAKITPTLNSYLGGSISLASALNTSQINIDNIINGTISPSTSNTTTPTTTTPTTTTPTTTTPTTIIGTSSVAPPPSSSTTATITVSTPGWELLSFLSIAILALEVVIKRRKFNQ